MKRVAAYLEERSAQIAGRARAQRLLPRGAVAQRVGRAGAGVRGVGLGRGEVGADELWETRRSLRPGLRWMGRLVDTCIVSVALRF